MVETDSRPVIAGLYAITDPSLLNGDRLLSACEQALRGGARILQYRDKPASASERLARGKALRALCQRYGAIFIINDDIALAAATGADGVHLGQADGRIEDAREQLGQQAIVGFTCHGNTDLADQAAKQGADYVAFGRFFPSQTKPHALPAALQVLHHPLSIPKVAIGGVSHDNAPQLVRAGASALAVIHALFASNDIESSARQFATLFPED
jgi:thiamine-phosphate pyrophosphorylase